jgi:hypothetical protein
MQENPGTSLPPFDFMDGMEQDWFFCGLKSRYTQKALYQLGGKEVNVMKKVLMMFMALLVMAVFSFGCGVDKEAKVKCPKCGAVFNVQEGIDTYNRK